MTINEITMIEVKNENGRWAKITPSNVSTADMAELREAVESGKYEPWDALECESGRILRCDGGVFKS